MVMNGGGFIIAIPTLGNICVINHTQNTKAGYSDWARTVALSVSLKHVVRSQDTWLFPQRGAHENWKQRGVALCQGVMSSVHPDVSHVMGMGWGGTELIWNWSGVQSLQKKRSKAMGRHIKPPLPLVLHHVSSTCSGSRPCVRATFVCYPCCLRFKGIFFDGWTLTDNYSTSAHKCAAESERHMSCKVSVEIADKIRLLDMQTHYFRNRRHHLQANPSNPNIWDYKKMVFRCSLQHLQP